MKAILKVAMDNAAFEDAPYRELARVLRNLAQQLDAETSYGPFTALDSNGNYVGKLEVQP